MNLADIAAGTSLFVDANVLVYYATSHATLGPSCRLLMERIGRQQITAHTSAGILNNVAHRVMLVEAAATLGRSVSGMTSHLKQHPLSI